MTPVHPSMQGSLDWFDHPLTPVHALPFVLEYRSTRACLSAAISGCTVHGQLGARDGYTVQLEKQLAL